MLKIEGGCTQDYRGKWRYDYTTVAGHYIVYFDAAEGEKPEIGDFIDASNRLVKRQGYQINDDHRMWKERFEDTRAYDKMDPPKTW